MLKCKIESPAPASRRLPPGMGAFLAGVLLLAVPTLAMVASTTLPPRPGHWIVVMIGIGLAVYGVFEGTEDLS